MSREYSLQNAIHMYMYVLDMHEENRQPSRFHAVESGTDDNVSQQHGVIFRDAKYILYKRASSQVTAS